MLKYPGYLACVLVLSSTLAMAEDKGASENADEKVISGMSIVGNNETPKSLVIVPWKSSEIGQETKLKSNLLNDGMNPVDHAVFMLELDFYKLANPK